MPPLMLDIVVDDQGPVVPQHVAQTGGQDIPVGSSSLSLAESVALQDLMQRATRGGHAVPSLNAMAAQAAAEFQRLSLPQATIDFQRLVAPVASLIEQTTAAQAHAAVLTENARFQKMLSSVAEETTRLQRFQKELWSSLPLIESRWEEDNERLQKMVASFRTDERLQRMLASFQAIEGPMQSLINPLKEDHERLQRIAASFRAMEKSIQPLIAPPWFTALRDALLPFPASIIPTWVQEFQIDYAASERRMCANALEAFSHDPEHAMWFVTKLLTFPRSYFTAVWQALHEGRWMNADKPLKYVRGVAWRIHKRDAEQQTLLLFNESFLSFDASPSGTLLPPTLHASCDPWPEHETRHDAEQRLEQQGLAAGLSPDALFIYKLRGIHGKDLSRRTLPTLLGWSIQRVERAWRELCRKKKKLG